MLSSLYIFQLSLPGVMSKLASGLTGLSPSIMVASSYLNSSSVMDPYFLVPLEDTMGEGGLVITVGFF